MPQPYEVTLEEAIGKVAEVDYPRLVARNEPDYRYCPTCKEEGRETIATYICIECSNRRQEEVLMCEDCVSPEHDDHYLEEIVY